MCWQIAAIFDLTGEINCQLGPSLYFSAIGSLHHIELNGPHVVLPAAIFFVDYGVNITLCQSN